MFGSDESPVLNDGWYKTKAKVQWEDGVRIHNRVTVNGDVKLIISNGTDVFPLYGGIDITPNSTLTIYAEVGANPHNLSVGTTDKAKAAINVPENAKLIINGGEINVSNWHTLRGNDHSASVSQGSAIGGDKGESCGNITINGGVVSVNAESNAAAIGGGSDDGQAGNGGKVTVNGGTVTVNAETTSIGSGYTSSGAGGDLTVNGGKLTVNCVVAYQGVYLCIGAGGAITDEGTTTAKGGTVTITGGEVTSGKAEGSYGKVAVGGADAIKISAAVL